MDKQNDNWYINSNKLRAISKWSPELKLKPKDEIRRLKDIIEDFLGCKFCTKNPDFCDYNSCKK